MTGLDVNQHFTVLETVVFPLNYPHNWLPVYFIMRLSKCQRLFFHKCYQRTSSHHESLYLTLLIFALNSNEKILGKWSTFGVSINE